MRKTRALETKCKNGHEYSVENILIVNNKRRCKTCKHNADSRNYQKNKEKIKQRINEYYAVNRDARLEYHKKYREENPEIVKERHAKWSRENKTRHLENVNSWRKNNPDKLLINRRTWHTNRRARLLNAPGNFSFENWLLKVVYYGWRCFYCKIDLAIGTLTMDHRKPLAKGGSNWLSNLVPACKSCNSRKHAKWD